MGWEHKVGNVKIDKWEGLENEFGRRWDGAKSHLQTRMVDGVKLAPVMVSCAMDALMDYAGAVENTWAKTERAREAEIGLKKYFEWDEILKVDTKPDRWLGGMLSVYNYVWEGMNAGYDMILYSTKDGAKGKTALDGVDRSGATSSSLVRSAFRFVDEYGHADWQGFTGGLRINMNWLAEPPPPGYGNAEALARVLVHEGTHRWAQTKDVLYKHNSAAWNANEAEAASSDAFILEAYQKGFGAFKWKQMKEEERTGLLEKQKAESLKTAKEARQVASQNTVAVDRPGNKPMHTLNVRGDKTKSPIDPIRWLENADSYSWFARRMWKRAGKPTK